MIQANLWLRIKRLTLLAGVTALLTTFPNCGGVGGSSTITPPTTTPTPTPAPPSAPVPLPTNLTLTSLITGLTFPVDLQQPNDGSGRLFIVEHGGRIRLFQNGALAQTPFLDIRSKVTERDEMGLLGLAFHPNYSQNGLFYVYYNRTTSGGDYQSVVSEFKVSSGDPNQADAGSERILLTVGQPSFTNHKAGQVAFGPDGFLYIALGDGGGSGNPLGSGQDPQTLLAKILRIDVNTKASGKEYGIPADNPFVGGGGLPETWASGFRNPFRFSIDMPTGRLFLGDVGEDRYEEIDIVQRGGNYGWNIMEGFHCFNPQTGCNQSGLQLPIAEYDHSEGNSIIGGYVYHGTKIPGLQNAYVFGDDGSGKIWVLQETSPGTWKRTQIISTELAISSFGQDQSGELYVVDFKGGVYRITQPQ